MSIKFYKYHGTGNDFILIDGMQSAIEEEFNREIIAKICHRRFGIGADGFIILSPSEDTDFNMIYYNSDGNRSSMCGNGSRCLIRFAHSLGYIGEHTTFEAADGLHEGKVMAEVISVKMKDVTEIEKISADYFLDTGSPHYVQFAQDIDALKIREEAHKIRYDDRFKSEGTNVNFVEAFAQGIQVRTYERGVEDETYSCGTGVVAAALAHNFLNPASGKEIKIRTKGGNLTVSFELEDGHYKNIWLTGPAQKVFEGQLELI